MPVQLDFIVRSFAVAAEGNAALRQRQPYRAACEHDAGWLGTAMVKHYQGDDGDLMLLIGALSEISVGIEVEAYAGQALAFFAEAQDPKLILPPRQSRSRQRHHHR